ncbi:phosphatase PAP2 family protein [Brevundimonas aveniformis]|uniref:phosphatase PAP2 family protein n=1 Tax=Brevundimonas aveniformis TaxID=370977 RepID=UPI0024900CCF|nr:phosphatase PAP2 family protein [Brevundimonas aveniformis]
MRRPLATAALLLVSAACAPVGARVAPVATETGQAERPAAYLDTETHQRLGLATPLPPEPGSAAERADQVATRAGWVAPGSPRWTLAQNHAEISPALALGHFDCPLGTRLSESPPPALVRLFSRALEDISASARVAKARIFRPRPFVDDPSVATCIRVDDSYRTNSSAPSSHATAGIVFGLIMADAAPDQADALTYRGRVIGESRLVCGLHYAADVTAGQQLGYELFEAIVATPAYQADIAQARSELAAARQLGHTNPTCAAERLALGLN